MDTAPFEIGSHGYPDRTEWDSTAADLVATMLQRWHLVAGDAFIGGAAAAVLRVTQADGSPAVLKVAYPHVEAIWEAVGLEAAGPALAPRVIRQDAWTWSLLLEDIQPGVPLSRAGLPIHESLVIGGELLGALHARPVPAFVPTLASAMGEYARQAAFRMPGQQASLDQLGIRDLVDRAIGLLGSLADSATSSVLLHGDFNPGNILRDGSRDGWVAVDPKPMAGDPAFDLWPLVAQVGGDLRESLEIASEAAAVNSSRAAQWAFARTGINVTWYLEDGNVEQAAIEAANLSGWAELVGS